MSIAQEHKRKTLSGKIVKASSANTLKVRVEIKYPHPKYGKIIKHHTNYLAHDNNIEGLNIGDKVKIVECPPISKTKKWLITEKFS